MDQVQQRKDDHIRICLEEDVQSGQMTGLRHYQLEYDALPEIDLAEVNVETEILGKRLAAPLLIGSMTGGSERAGEFNHRIAQAASAVGIGMGLGSQRVMLKDGTLRETYAVRQKNPDLPLLIGNIGAVQLRHGMTANELRQLVEQTQADALYFHLNPLQEAIQPEGDTEFRDLLALMHECVKTLPFPCLVKEVGAGISEKTAKKLATLNIAGIEASGVGGTSWARVEGYRAAPQSISAQLGERLRGFGVPTAASILACRQHFPTRCVIGSGGIRTGMDVAIALALGADAVAIARPVLEAAQESAEAVEAYLRALIHELRVICFCTGARNLDELRQVRLFPDPRGKGNTTP